MKITFAQYNAGISHSLNKDRFNILPQSVRTLNEIKKITLDTHCLHK